MSNDHIIFPKSSLLRFSQSGKFTYLDLKDNMIKGAFAKTYNTAEEYYPPTTEKFLSREIETLLGRLNSSLDVFFGAETDTYTMPPEIFENIIKCLAIQRLRLPKTMELINQKSIFAQFAVHSVQVPSPLQFGNLFIQDAIRAYTETFKNHTATVCVVDKNCSASFVLPSLHSYELKGFIFLVLSPDRAFVLQPKEFGRKNNGSKSYIRVTDDDDFVPGYESLINDELNYGDGILVGLRSELQKIQSYINKKS